MSLRSLPTITRSFLSWVLPGNHFWWTENVNSFPEKIQFYIIFEIRVFSHFRLQSEKNSTNLKFSVRKMCSKNEIKHMIEHAIKFLILWTVYNWSWMIEVDHVMGKHVVLKYGICSKIKYTEITCTYGTNCKWNATMCSKKGIRPFLSLGVVAKKSSTFGPFTVKVRPLFWLPRNKYKVYVYRFKCVYLFPQVDFFLIYRP